MKTHTWKDREYIYLSLFTYKTVKLDLINMKFIQTYYKVIEIMANL